MKYLEKEFSIENIKFWLAVNDFKRASESDILQKSKEIFELVLPKKVLYSSFYLISFITIIVLCCLIVIKQLSINQ